MRHYAAPQAVVLMYHRIAAPVTDVWDLAVAPARFEQQLRVLKGLGTVVAAPELAERLKKRVLRRRSLVITFDDGYLDNYLVAKPLLEQVQLPATFFVASGAVGQVREFWWDELEAVFLQSARLPGEFSLLIQDQPVQADLTTEQQLSSELRRQHHHWRADTAPPPTARAALFYRVWQLLRPLPYAEQQLTLEQIRAWARAPAPARPDYQIVSGSQLRELGQNPLFTIGAHTVTHPALASHGPAFQARELSASRQALREATGQNVELLAYPYGNFGAETPGIAAEVGFKAAFTTQAGLITNASESYQLGRFQVADWDGDEFRRRLRHWLG